MFTIEELKEKWAGLSQKAKALTDSADAEKRDMTADEVKSFDAYMNAADATEQEILRRERLATVEAKLTAPAARVTKPDDAAAAAASARATVTGGDKPGASKGTNGFQSLGEFAISVRAVRAGGPIDARLRPLMAASTYGNEMNGGDGGYAVPPDFRSTILKKVQGEDSLLALTDQYTTSFNEIVMPVDETTPWQSTGGVQAGWMGEGATITGSKPALGQLILRANKIGAIVPITDELLTDAQQIDSYLSSKVPEKITYALNSAIIGGDGSGKPQGILNGGGTVSAAIEATQALSTGGLVYGNIVKMWSLMYAPLRRNAVWLINQDLEPWLFKMAVGAVAGGVVAYPAYLPPGGLSSAPYGTLLGRPVLYSEACSAVGTVGDIIFADPKQYATVLKSGGMKTDVSIHLYFDQDVTAFRTIMRVGGAPWWKTSIARAKSALPLGCAVTLAARTG